MATLTERIESNKAQLEALSDQRALLFGDDDHPPFLWRGEDGMSIVCSSYPEAEGYLAAHGGEAYIGMTDAQMTCILDLSDNAADMTVILKDMLDATTDANDVMSNTINELTELIARIAIDRPDIVAEVKSIMERMTDNLADNEAISGITQQFSGYVNEDGTIVVLDPDTGKEISVEEAKAKLTAILRSR